MPYKMGDSRILHLRKYWLLRNWKWKQVAHSWGRLPCRQLIDGRVLPTEAVLANR